MLIKKVHKKNKRNLERFIVLSKAYAWNILEPNRKSSAHDMRKTIKQ
jgi:hypothetical protein